MNKEMKFEQALKKLEEIVGKLEEGETPLEKSLELFEEGIRLSRFCSKKLDEAERKIEILHRSENGTESAQPFEEGDGDSEDTNLS